MARERVSRWAQRSVAAGALFLVVWHLAAIGGAGRRTLVTLALQGFVLHVVLGKALSLVPSYFDRTHRAPWLAGLQVPLTAAGAGLLAVGSWTDGPVARRAGAVLWAAGVVAFLVGIAWTLRDNPLGAETGTGDSEADRRRVDRIANAAVPVALAYLLAGTYALTAPATGLPSPLDGYPPRSTHLLAAGFAALTLFAVGFRLLPRFTVTTPPRGAALVVLPAGAVGPALVAVGLPAGPLLHAGALIESVAVLGFAVTVGALYRRTDRDRVGLDGVLAGAVAGVAATGLALWMAVDGVVGGLARAHLRLNLLGLLGLSVVGVAYQFYPPSVGSGRLANDQTALASILALAAGLGVQAVGLVADRPLLAAIGAGVGAVGATLFAVLVVGLLRERGQIR